MNMMFAKQFYCGNRLSNLSLKSVCVLIWEILSNTVLIIAVSQCYDSIDKRISRCSSRWLVRLCSEKDSSTVLVWILYIFLSLPYHYLSSSKSLLQIIWSAYGKLISCFALYQGRQKMLQSISLWWASQSYLTSQTSISSPSIWKMCSCWKFRRSSIDRIRWRDWWSWCSN